jgi:hypothetical protein
MDQPMYVAEQHLLLYAEKQPGEAEWTMDA